MFAARPVARRLAFSARRFESTTASSAANKASETAASAASKASETAASAASKASEAAANAASKASETAANAAVKAKETAAKAAQGLTRVASTAGPAITNAAKNASEALGKVGGRTGRFIHFVERQVPFVIYYSKVAVEVAKIVFRGQNMTPPPLNTFQTYFQNAFKQLQKPGVLAEQISAKVSAAAQPGGISRAQMAMYGVLGAELLGFFTVGEMVGRMKIVGYRGESPAAHH